jgi:hypothetical protein
MKAESTARGDGWACNGQAAIGGILLCGAAELITIAGVIANLGRPAPGRGKYPEAVSFMTGDRAVPVRLELRFCNSQPSAQRTADYQRDANEFLFVSFHASS